ncbi:MAG TPA: ABC transporter [Eubacterium sp.]|nr:ABC transporter [Eubacterium sp.]HAX58421.1 ABC transporter [Eubacterium sp.]HAZ85554.1 ABC transporter [Eubacterium sp.]
MVLACNNISKSFGIDEIIKNASFNIEEREKAAIVGINGAGKTTLLRIIMGEYQADSGEVIIAKDRTIGYLAQHQKLSGDNTIYDELLSVKKDIIELEQKIRRLELEMHSKEGVELEAVMEAYSKSTHQFELQNGYAYKSEVVGVLKGLGFDESDFEKKMNTLSGGQKTRVALGRLLLSKPDIIMLDEPTNHLDMNSIAWLENYLVNYDGSVIIVAHDRYFLDKVVTKVIEVERGIVSVFSGNYSDYAAKKKQLMDAKLKEYYNQQRDIKHQEEVIAKLKSFNREKSIKRAESREKLLDKIEVIDKPITEQETMHFKLEPAKESGNDVLSVEGLSKAFGGNRLFDNVSFEIKKGEKVALIGNNGTGKTTILKIINHIIEADAGKLKLGANVEIGYYDQEHNVLHMDKTAFDEIGDAYPDMTNTQIRNMLACFLFTGDDVFKKISDLSGGERGRVSLAKLMLSNANFLILDEPTNHLDIMSKEILESALNRYTGTVLYVSHDRYFINKTASRIMELSANTVTNYIGNYDYYLEKRDILAPKEVKQVSSEKNTAVKDDWKAQKEEQAKLRKRQNDIAKIEKSIEQLEKDNSELDEQLALPEVYSDVKQLMKLNEKKQEIEKKLEKLYEDWETLSADE